MSALRPHDLLWVADPLALHTSEALPAWAHAAWLQQAPLVVRRERTGADRIPVGLRGMSRNQRLGAHVSTAAVGRVLRPEDLVESRAWRAWTSSHETGAIAALALLAPQLDASGLAWGPAGGVGFALASGIAVLGPDSDLDLVVRAPSPPTRRQRAALAALAGRVRCRLDIQMDTGSGAFALCEWLGGRGRVLLKTDAGPVLIADPWSHPGACVARAALPQ